MPKETINIHDLDLTPEPEREKPIFDLKRDVRESDIEEIKKHIEKIMKRDVKLEDLRDISCSIRSLITLFPERASELNITKEALQKLKSGAELHKKVRYWWIYIRFASTLKLLSPELFEEIEVSDEDFDSLEQDIEVRGSNKNWPNYLEIFHNFQLLTPEKAQEMPKPNKEDVQGIKEQVEIYKKSSNWYWVSRYTAHLKTISPEVFKELNITKEDIENMKKEMEEYRAKNDWYNFSEITYNLQIITAEKVEVTNQGLKFTMPKLKEEFDVAIPPVPEIRRLKH